MHSAYARWQRAVQASRTPAMTLTLSYYAAFIALGLSSAVLGPTLLGLAEQTGSTLSQISYLFTARALGYLGGSLLGGRLYDRLPGNRTMAGALLVLAALMAFVPTVPLLGLLIALMLALGVMEAVVDVGGNTLIVWVHRKGVGPFMNGLHLFFAVGAFLAPLLIAQVILWSGTFGAGYWLLALLFVPIALRLVPLPNPQPLAAHTDDSFVRPHLGLLTLIVTYFILVAGGESSFAGWIYTYSVKAELMSETTAAYLNSAFWGAFMLSRIASIPLSTRLRPRVIILADLGLSITGLALIFLLPQSVPALWVGVILFGVGIASAFPTMLTFAGRHMTITGSITGWFFVGASFGSMLIPWLIGQLFEPLGPQVVPLLVGAAMCLALGAFFAVLAVTKRHPKV